MFNTEVLTQTSSVRSRVRPLVRDALLVLGASAIIALSAQVRIPLPFTPVPISMESFAVLFLAALLGSRRGALAVTAFLAEGALGLPVFSGGHSGILYFAGATGGYLVGFVLAAYLTGWLMEKRECVTHNATWKRAGIALFLGNVAIYALGVAWLATLVGFKAACTMGLLPFLIGDAIKFALALFGTRVIKPFKP